MQFLIRLFLSAILLAGSLSPAMAGTIFKDQAIASTTLTIYVDHNVASGVVATVPAGSALTLETGPYGVNADWWYGKDNASGAAGWFQASGIARAAVAIPDGRRWIHVTIDDAHLIYQARLMVDLAVVDVLNIRCGAPATPTPEGTYQTVYKSAPLFELPSHPGIYLRWWQTWRDDGPGTGGAWGLHTWILEKEGWPIHLGQYGRGSTGCVRLPRAGDVYNFLPLNSTVYVEYAPYAGPTTDYTFNIMIKRSLTDVNVRTGPGAQYPIIGHAAGGQAYVATQESMGWYRITFNGQAGWIWGGLLIKLPEPQVTLTPASLAFTMVEKRAVAGSTPPPAPVSVREPNNKPLWSIVTRPSQTWLTTTAILDQAFQIYVNAGANTLAAGSYSAAVTVTATDAIPASVAVTLNVLRDTDGDGTPDVTDGDDDNDGLWDTEEAAHGTNALKADTDGDGTSDLAEVIWGSDPKNAAQKAGDPLRALFQVKVNTSLLNVRQGPGTRFALLGRAVSGQIYTVYKQDSVFYRITFAGKAGWVHSAYVVKYVPPSIVMAVRIKTGLVNINVRATNSTTGAILGQVQGGQIYVSDLQSGGWFRVRFDSRYGWVRGDFAAKVAASTVRVTVTELNVRTGPGTGYSIFGKTYSGYRYGVAGSTTGWTKIWYRGRTLWVSNGGVVRVAL